MTPYHSGTIMNLMAVTIFLCGDVMTGRGIDQVLPRPSAPGIHEYYVTDARDYVALAEQASGPLAKPLSFSAVWGDALVELEQKRPDVRVVNLETAVTVSEDYWRGKGINYRMHPANVGVLSAAAIDVAELANNHVLDWGYAGLAETIATLDKEKVAHAGAGRNAEGAEAPAVVSVPGKGRVLVFSFAAGTSGVPFDWAAGEKHPGVNLLPDLSETAVSTIGERIRRLRKPGDIVIVSIHWGENWGYDIAAEEVRFSHGLIDKAGVDLIHGHSSHHVKAFEIYHGKLVLYGCGDFLNDYEGISGREEYRPGLGLMYFPKVDAASGRLISLEMTPTRVRHFTVRRASPGDAAWLAAVLNREGRRFGTSVEETEGGRLRLGRANEGGR